MFSSLASLIFGSNTSATTNCEENNQPLGEEIRQQQQQQQQGDQRENVNLVRIDAEHTINVTSTTPSVTGTTTNDTNTVRQQQQQQGGKRNNKRNNNKQNRQRRNPNQKGTPTITKLLTPNESSDEDLDEDDWFIVEKEDESDSLPRTDSEEELSVVEIKGNSLVASSTTATPTHQQQQQQQRRRQHINSHSLYSGPRPQQQRNLLQRARCHNGGRNTHSLLSPPQNAAAAGNAGSAGATADAECISQSLYVTAPASAAASSSSSSTGVAEFAATNANIGMEESWFVTPPPCFTSIGPINMETSPYENLLIEHPSMSVYHSIRSAQEAAESFVNLDLGMSESPRPRRRPVVAATVSVAAPAEATVAVRTPQAAVAAAPQQPRATSVRADRFTAAQLKQEMFARSTQKNHDKQERQYLCRGAIKRSNKARDFQSRGQRQRRSDMQHCKLLSGVNNNRKCCF